MLRYAGLILVVCSVCVPAFAAQEAAPQTTAAAAVAPQFDVASIHPHIPEPHEHNSITSSSFDGHFHAENLNVPMLIRWAYEIPETRILGAPAWAGSTYFNIDAKADPAVDQQLHDLTADVGRHIKERMVQGLLADRFKLALHTETRELPIYALVVAKSGTHLGDTKSDGTTVNHGRDHIEVQGSNSLMLLAEELSKEVGRPVVDKTGIAGRYDLMLRWTPDNGAIPAPGGSDSGADSAPSLLTALEEQLGLKLESEKGPVQVLVIDHVEQPTQN